jgi:hypothetical protein
MTILQYQKAIHTINANLLTWVEEIVISLEGDITDMVKWQLAEGKRGDGKDMPPYRSLSIISKKDRGAILMDDNIALIDQGDYWDSFFVKAELNSFIIDASDWKNAMLQKRYGKEILMLSDAHRNDLSTLIIPRLKAKFDETFAKA